MTRGVINNNAALLSCYYFNPRPAQYSILWLARKCLPSETGQIELHSKEMEVYLWVFNVSAYSMLNLLLHILLFISRAPTLTT